MKNSEATRIKRNTKRRAWAEKMKGVDFPKTIARTCKGCGGEKEVRWNSTFDIHGNPEYKSRCDDCQNAKGRTYRAGKRQRFAELVRHRRQALKEKMVEMLGGACFKCGYDRSTQALSFHHRDRDTKEMDISQVLNRWSLERIVAEVKKCIPLCMNCHMEAEEVHDDGYRPGRRTVSRETKMDWDACGYDERAA